MGSSSNEPVAIHASIALLQERFKKLQRLKEIREGKELSKALAEPKWYNSANAQQEPEMGLFFHPELIIQQRPPPHLSLPLWLLPDSQTQTKQRDPRCVEPQAVLMMSLWSKEKQANNMQNNNLCNRFDDSASDDIDTSLHL